MVPIRRSIKYVGITITFKVRVEVSEDLATVLYQVVVEDTHIRGRSYVVWIGWCSQGRKWFNETRGRVNTMAMVGEF